MVSSWRRHPNSAHDELAADYTETDVAATLVAPAREALCPDGQLSATADENGANPRLVQFEEGRASRGAYAAGTPGVPTPMPRPMAATRAT